MLPFTEEPLQSPNWFQRLFGLKVKKNAVTEINNMFAASDNICFFTSAEIESVMTAYKTNLANRPEFLALYEKYLNYAISNNRLDKQDMSILTHLQTLLALHETRTQQLRQDRTRDHYRQELFKRSETKCLSEVDVQFLNNIRDNLFIPKDVTLKIHSELAKSLMNSYLKPILEIGLYSPDQQKGLEDMLNAVRLDELDLSCPEDVALDEKTKDQLVRCQYQWLVQYGEIPAISVNINLHKNEKCYMAVNTILLEYRKVTRRVNYGGPTLSVKIAKGVYWRAGSLGVQRVSEDVLTKIDQGSLYVTNQRLIFTGGQKNSTIRFAQILDFHSYKNGIEIEKESGKNPFFEFNHEVGLFTSILARGIHDSAI